MEPFPALDFVLRGEPEYTFKELVETLGREERDAPDATPDLAAIQGLVWRRGGEIVVNPDRPFIANLDDLPMPLHHLLPLRSTGSRWSTGPYTFIVTSRGCPAGCRFCIKHVSYQHSVRVRSPENIQAELWELDRLGVHNVHMYADLFTVNREQVVGLCELLIREGPKVRWTCNSRVDFVDEEMLRLMGEGRLLVHLLGHRVGQPRDPEAGAQGHRPRRRSSGRCAGRRPPGIKNWGYFIIGLPGETEETIRQTIDFAKRLPLDLALFHIAAPYPGTPFFFEVVENGWFRPGTRWEEVDMDRSTVLDYPDLKAEDLERWQKRAFREWALRPGPALTYLKMLATPGTLRSALEVGLRHLAWARG